MKNLFTPKTVTVPVESLYVVLRKAKDIHTVGTVSLKAESLYAVLMKKTVLMNLCFLI